ncbi:MAG: hypothetical protein U9Q68_03560 [Euryarchaeota archaeon]|nr:hypothetical protein [Euryarchaeota archaeon]
MSIDIANEIMKTGEKTELLDGMAQWEAIPAEIANEIKKIVERVELPS